MIDADPIVLSGLVAAVYTLVCLILVFIIVRQNDRIEVLEAEVGIVERKEYRVENQLSVQEKTLAERLPTTNPRSPS